MFSAIVGWNVLYMSARSLIYNVKSLSLLIFCLVVLSII